MAQVPFYLLILQVYERLISYPFSGRFILCVLLDVFVNDVELHLLLLNVSLQEVEFLLYFHLVVC